MIVENEKELSERLKEIISNKDYAKNYSIKLKELAKGYSFYDKDEDSINRLVNLFFKIIE